MGAIVDRYLDHLSSEDLELLAASSPSADAAHFRDDPGLIEPALAHPSTYASFFESHDRDERLVRASPFLLFATAVHRALIDLDRSSFVEERVGPHKRLPIFDTSSLATHFAILDRRIAIIEHLESYTRVSSGPVWVRRGNRWRKTRYSELDPTGLAALLDAVEPSLRSGVYRRLGDLALFPTGVFPDHTARRTVHPIELERLLRTLRSVAAQPFGHDELDQLAGAEGHAGLLCHLGPLWYRRAAELSPLPPVTAALHDAADGFDCARRFLVHVTDRYLFNDRDRLFGPLA